MPNLKLLKSLIKKGRNIVVTTHNYPDADGIGSEIALCLALRKKGFKAFCVNETPLEERYQYLDRKKVVKGLKEFKKNGDLLIVVDTNSIKRIGPNMGKFAKKFKDILFIDHHPINNKNLIPKNIILDEEKCATGEVVGNLIEKMGIKFSFDMAQALYTAILIDTSSFRYPKVSANTHKLLAKLLDSGVNPPSAYNFIYGTKKISHMKLLGKILSNIQSTEDQSIAWIIVTKSDLKNYFTKADNTNSFINNLLVLDNLKVACLFRESKDKVKVSLRSDGTVDVGKIAEEFGGGGHSHSGGIILHGKISTIIKKVIKKIKSRL